MSYNPKTLTLSVALASVLAAAGIGIMTLSGDVQADQARPEVVASYVAPEVLDMAKSELEGSNLEFAPGVKAPGIAELVPTAAGATVQSSADDEIVLRGNQENPAVRKAMTEAGMAPEDGAGVEVHLAEGDLAVSEALYWQCGWIDAYLDASRAGDTTLQNAAREHLNQFPTLPDIVDYAPDFVEEHQDIVVPMLDGDLQVGDHWMATSCKNFSGRP